MEYAKFIKAHPLPEITEEQRSAASAIEPRNYYNHYYMYTADVVDDKLVVMIYGEEKDGTLVQIYRHIYDGESYATQRIEDGHRLNGQIASQLFFYDTVALDKRTEQAFAEYFPEEETPGIETLYHAEEKILGGKLKKKHDKIKKRIDDRLACVPEIPKAFDDWLKDTVLKPFRYFFYSYKRGKAQTGYCSHCKSVFAAEKVRHGAEIVCPSCGSTLQCRALGKITKYPIINNRYVVLIQQITDGGEPALIQRYCMVTQRISCHTHGAKECTVSSFYTEEKREFLNVGDLSQRLSPWGENKYYYGAFLSSNERRWCEYSSGACSGYAFSESGYICPIGLNELAASAGMPNIDLEAVVPHIKTDLKRLSAALKKYPAAENLAKQGMYKLLAEINDSAGYRYNSDNIKKYVKPAERSPSRFLGIDKPTLDELGDISAKEFILYKKLQARGYPSTELFKRYAVLGLAERGPIDLFLNKKVFPPIKLIGYLEKQSRLLKKNGWEVLELYRDYLSMADDLKMPATESTLFPKDIKKEHDVLIEYQAKLKHDKEIADLAKRGELLHTLDWSDGRYIIRAFDKPEDFLNESTKLHHCVKTYVKRCAAGETNIYGIRKASAPDEPYFTLTLSNNAVVTTNLGLRNCQPPKEVKDFVQRWLRKVVDKHKDEFIEKANMKTKKARKTA